MPVETEFEISNNSAELVLNVNSIVINEVDGNDNGVFNPSETISLSFDIVNLDSNSINNLQAELSTNSSFINISNNLIKINSIGSSQTYQVNDSFSVSSPPNMSDNESPELRLDI